jgi:large subunit ribosomal protein L5
MSEFKELYDKSIRSQLKKALGLSSLMAVPRLKSITLNMGVGEAVADKKVMNHAVADMTAISGQKPKVTLARKSIAGFKIREEWPIGCKVTLRGKRMYDFLESFVKVVAPRIRDFRGLSKKSFDGRGNYNFGIKEQVVFPTIDYDKIDKIRGLNITITTTAASDAEALALLRAFQFPIKA